MPSVTLSTDKRICFWGAPSGLSATTRVLDQCMIECGQNTGNLFIGSGLFTATRAPIKEYWDFYPKTPEEFDEKFDVLFVPASNFIFEYTDLKDQYDFFSRTRAQIFMFGLGSQLRELKSIKIPTGTENFIRLASERSSSIGVRGEVTADVVRSFGISNVDVVGCPSMLTIPDDFAPTPDIGHPSTVVSGNFTNNARDHAFSAGGLLRTEERLFAELLKLNGYYILQNERHEIALQKSLAYVAQLSDDDIWHLQKVAELFSSEFPSKSLTSFLRWRTKLFFTTKEWIRFMETTDFSFGTRFHGNVAAIRAGRPAYILCHDFRTLELCKLYKIPHRVVDAHSPVPTIRELAEECDMRPFALNYAKLSDVWMDFIEKNGFTAEKHAAAVEY